MKEQNRQLVVGILAHVDAGKTTLSEGLLYLCGGIKEMGRVDHGTAFDKAGKNLANEASMVEALQLAAQMAPYYQKKE